MFWGVLEILWWCYVLRVSVLDVLMSCCLGTLETWSKDIFWRGFVILNICQERFLQFSGKRSTIFRREMLCKFIFSMISEEVVWFSTMFRSGCMIFYNFHGKFLQFSGEVAWFSIIFGRGCMNLYNFSGEARGRFALFYIIFQERLCDFISFFRRGCVILYHF